MYVWIEDSVFFRRAARPPNTVLVSNIAAKHLGLAAEITLSHEGIPPGRKNYGQTLESVARASKTAKYTQTSKVSDEGQTCRPTRFPGP